MSSVSLEPGTIRCGVAVFNRLVNAAEKMHTIESRDVIPAVYFAGHEVKLDFALADDAIEATGVPDWQMEQFRGLVK